jgi:hypothetical protein
VTIVDATAVPGRPPIGVCLATTVELDRMPSMIVGNVVAPTSVQRMRTSTDPLAGAVNVIRALAVSNAVMASRDEVAFETATAGS